MPGITQTVCLPGVVRVLLKRCRSKAKASKEKEKLAKVPDEPDDDNLHTILRQYALLMLQSMTRIQEVW